jgi:hypothetical protein
MEIVLSVAPNLTTVLLKAGVRRLGDAALGDAQQRKLEDVVRRALASMLTEMAGAESVGEHRELLALLEEQFTSFFGDPEVAYGFLEVALTSEPLPVDRLCQRFEELGFDPDTFLVSFERAMTVFSLQLAELVEAEASSQDSPINNLVEVAKLSELTRTSRELLRRTEPVGPTAEKLERESWARCKRRWTLLGVPPEEVETLAKNPIVGAPAGRRGREGVRLRGTETSNAKKQMYGEDERRMSQCPISVSPATI